MASSSSLKAPPSCPSGSLPLTRTMPTEVGVIDKPSTASTNSLSDTALDLRATLPVSPHPGRMGRKPYFDQVMRVAIQRTEIGGVLSQDLAQQRRLDVSPGEHHHRGPTGRRGAPVCGERYCTARLADEVGAEGDLAHGVTNIVLGHGDHVIENLLQMREGQFGRLRPETIGDGSVAVLDGPVHPGASAQACRRVAGQFG